MDTLTHIIAAILVLLYGCAGVWTVIKQQRVSHILLAGVGFLLGGVAAYPFLLTVSAGIAWFLVIALVLCILGFIFG